MKTDRLIGILTILMQQGRATAPQLAERFEVSRRTINRDIEDLCKAGIPLVTTQGYGGGISVANGYTLDKALLTRDEMETVLAGVKGINSVAQPSPQNTLLEKLGAQNGQPPQNSSDVIIVDLASHYKAPLSKKFGIIKDAITQHSTITFSYYYQKGESKREAEPYNLVYKWSDWYLFAYCLTRGGYRLFKLNRLWNLQQTDSTFSPRTVPEAEMQFDDYFKTDDIRLKAVFEPTEKYRLIEEYGIGCYATLASGRLLFEQSFASYNNMREWVFSFGDKVHIIEPQRLKADRIKQARSIIKSKKEHDA